MKTPLAWKNLTSSFSKCALAATGVGFAVVLMFMQIGFQRALIDNNVRMLELFDTQAANLAVVSKARYNVSTEQRFSRRLFELAASVDGVAGGCTVSLERGTAKAKVVGNTAKPVRVIAVSLGAPEFFVDPDLYRALESADRQDAALVDSRSKNFYGFGSTSAELESQWIELNDRSLPIAGQFQLGTDFGNDGTVLMSQRMHARYFPWRNWPNDPEEVVDIGLLKADIGKVEGLAAEIEALAPDQITVQTTENLIAEEKNFWARQTPIGKIFLIGTVMGLLVGAIICYQIQFTDISEHMPEFATLKAMGYGPTYFWSVILCQSFYLACLGFVPGVAVAYGLYWVLSESSGLIMQMTWLRVVGVWGLTMVMCAASGALAIRKLFGADPASLF